MSSLSLVRTPDHPSVLGKSFRDIAARIAESSGHDVEFARHGDRLRRTRKSTSGWVGTSGRWATPARRGTISHVTSRPAAAQHVRGLVLLRPVLQPDRPGVRAAVGRRGARAPIPRAT